MRCRRDRPARFVARSDHAGARSLNYRRARDRVFPRRAFRPNMFLSLLVVKNAFRHKLRTALTVVGIVVAITAFGLLRTIVDAWYAGANASSSARLVTRSAVSLVFSLPLTYAAEDPPGRRRALGLVGQLVRRRLHHRAQLLSAVRDRRADLSRHVPGVRAAGRGAQGVSRPTARARSSAASSPSSTAGRWATRSRCAARSTREPGRSRCAASTTAPTRAPTSRRCSSTGTLLNETIKKLYPRRADQTGVFIVAAARPGRRRPRSRRRSTRRSGTRSPRR